MCAHAEYNDVILAPQHVYLLRLPANAHAACRVLRVVAQQLCKQRRSRCVFNGLVVVMHVCPRCSTRSINTRTGALQRTCKLLLGVKIPLHCFPKMKRARDHDSVIEYASQLVFAADAPRQADPYAQYVHWAHGARVQSPVDADTFHATFAPLARSFHAEHAGRVYTFRRLAPPRRRRKSHVVHELLVRLETTLRQADALLREALAAEAAADSEHEEGEVR